MDADFSVELGAEDPTLDLPWEDAGTSLRHYDIRKEPDQLRFIDEAEEYRELHDFLAALNSQSSIFQTAKCDVWLDHELAEAEDIYDADTKLVSYVDFVFAESVTGRSDFAAHERMVRRFVEMLGRAPEMSSSAEFIIRRCYFRDMAEPESGFYISFYLAGYGHDEPDSRKNWGIALNLVQNALLQFSAEFRRQNSPN